MTSTSALRVDPGGALTGHVHIPGDKSISHRSVMLGAIADGVSSIAGFLDGADCLATLNAMRALGVTIEGPTGGQVTVHGVGLHGLQPPAAPLDLGNAGTGMRLLTGLLAGQRFASELVGDASLSRRPMRRVTEPLTAMGAHIDTSPAGTPPLRLRGGQPLRGIDYALPVASAQVKSALLLAGLYADADTTITEPAPTRDHTERMLAGFGARVSRAERQVCLHAGSRLQATAMTVPADLSSAAFFLVGASIAPGSELLLEHVGINPTRAGVLALLRLMGADIRELNPREVGGEPVADLAVRAAPLQGITIPPELVPLAIDEFPALFIAAACAQGETVLTDASELRVKESDRIQVMADGLAACGVTAEPRADGIRIVGGTLQGGRVHSHGDHRVAMAFAMAGLCAQAPILIEDCANVRTSFPGFVDKALQAGLTIEEVQA